MKLIFLLAATVLFFFPLANASNCTKSIGEVVTPKPKGIVQSEIDRLERRYKKLDQEWDRLDHQSLIGEQAEIANEMAEIQRKLDFLKILQKSR